MNKVFQSQMFLTFACVLWSHHTYCGFYIYKKKIVLTYQDCALYVASFSFNACIKILLACCSSMIPGSRNPMWGEEFNFSVDELPVQVALLL